MKIFLLAVPYDSGHYKKRLGAGPMNLLATTESRLKTSGHSVRVSEVYVDPNAFPTEVTVSFNVNKSIAQQVRGAISKGEFPVILAGNCSTAVGTLGGLNNGAGVIWFDCHGDFNTPETTIGGFLDGMSLSIVAGRCWKQLSSSVSGFKAVSEEKIMLVGARDFDELEMNNLSASPIRLITPAMLTENENILREIGIEADQVYLHIDLDVIDPFFVRVNSYSTPGGLSPDELLNAVQQVTEKYTVTAIAFTAYDPSMDTEGKVLQLVNEMLNIVLKHRNQ